MTQLLNKMYTKIKVWLKFAAKTFWQWLIHNFLTASLGSSILGVSVLGYTGNISISALSWLQQPLNSLPQELLLWHLLLLCLTIPFVFSLGVKFKEWRNKHSIYYFIESDGLKWRARKDKNKVKDFPFCPEHNRQKLNHKQIASRFGFAPHRFSSGSSVRGKTRSSGHGNSQMRSCMTMVARSVSHHYERFARYKQRKLAEGKPWPGTK